MKTLRTLSANLLALLILTGLYGLFVAGVLVFGGSSPLEWLVIGGFGVLWLGAMAAALVEGPLDFLLDLFDAVNRRY